MKMSDLFEAAEKAGGNAEVGRKLLKAWSEVATPADFGDYAAFMQSLPETKKAMAGQALLRCFQLMRTTSALLESMESE